jgi:glycosyltransferase involved in cell wall biosynthesis
VDGRIKIIYLLRGGLKETLKTPIVSPIDTQFNKRLKQIVGLIISSFLLEKCIYSYWTPGVRQYEFARLLGFSRSKILFNSLSCDVELFNDALIALKKKDYPKKFLYVGRFNKVKGLDLLISAWKRIENKNGWKFTLVGNGPEKINY